MSRPAPSPAEIQAFLADLNAHRERLVSLARTGSGPAEELAAAIDEIGAQLLIADEELRVQNEQLTSSARRLDLLVAAHEELFDNAPEAYVQTDQDGLIVRFNHAARDLLGLPTRTARSRTLTNMVRAEDRPAVRTLIGEVRATSPGPFTYRTPRPVEAVVIRDGGAAVPVVLTVRRSSDGGTGRVLLHWELRAHSPARPAAAEAGQPDRTADVLAAAALAIAHAETPTATLELIVAQAAHIVPGAEQVGATLLRNKRRLEAPAASGDLAARCDLAQQHLSEGPCLDALDTNTLVRCDDLADDTRWRHFAQDAVELGARSVLAVPLASPRGVLGALNIYSTRADAFGEGSEQIAEAFATHASVAIMHAELESNLRTGLTTREEIGRAVGILMERHRVSATGAFDMLVYASQHSHRKLRDVALWVNETGEDPDALLHSGG